ncbi:MAG: hypothetical protein COU32_02705 [Candidatus Magasanikbacteria bacterium CG10_big_fil_rev_8_21_14_0_10_42_10]|uniref:Uncharacterized protein n=2 Tax=Candidatus Magasanikiibacteriota TaxID=1752731 RepID=A0A2H0TVW1_9BACT|nr:MAG: hypothetical protein COU32_02705 [Candidatus Magasanikbacteria bacterium CG10_big_fil_rev_8_21_14_0_10_42_10]PIZ94501.1 MAG: hypothetical protein COX82_00500 [Candidatus Magasanikbacteria bacterium CG_4_10_14_0_2_um_filter_41_10]
MKYPLGWYLGLLLGMMVGLNVLGHFFFVLDTMYFQSHEDALTTMETFPTSDDSFGTNYYYTKTPYFFPYQISALAAFWIPLGLVLFWSIAYMKTKKTIRRFLQSLLFPVIYTLVNIIYFFMVIDPSLGWEYELGMSLLFFGCGAIFVFVVVVNSIFLLRERRRLASHL